MRNGPLAQPVEHWTFNPGVRGSNPRRLTHRKQQIKLVCCFSFYRFAQRRSLCYNKCKNIDFASDGSTEDDES